MKIVITGHTSGLGAILKQRYETLGHEVRGFSRSNGFDLSTPGNRAPALHWMLQSDIVFNNAPGIFQRDLFCELTARARDKRMVIVNIGSMASRFGPSKSMMYASDKAALDSAVLSHQALGPRWPAALLIRPSYFTGDRSALKTTDKVDVEDVATIIMEATQAALDDRYRINDIIIQK